MEAQISLVVIMALGRLIGDRAILISQLPN